MLTRQNAAAGAKKLHPQQLTTTLAIGVSVGGNKSLSSLSSSSHSGDHYQVLGVSKNANAADIKSAFYRLSKRYHPDMHSDTESKERASEKFSKVAAAYEVLGSVEKRRLYDLQLKIPGPSGATPYYNNGNNAASQTTSGTNQTSTDRARQVRQRKYTDLDIDYRDFEHFQRENRRRRQFQQQGPSINEFEGEGASEKNNPFTEFLRERERATWAAEAAAAPTPSYKSARAREREQRERALHEEIRRQQARLRPLPSLDQMVAHEARTKHSHGNVVAATFAVGLVFGGGLYLTFSRLIP